MTRLCFTCGAVYQTGMKTTCGHSPVGLRGTTLAAASPHSVRATQRRLQGETPATAADLVDYCRAVVPKRQRTGAVWAMVQHFASLERS